VPYDELATAGWGAGANPEVLAGAIKRGYGAFLDARAELMLQAIGDWCDGRCLRTCGNLGLGWMSVVFENGLSWRADCAAQQR
jgi:hypothetical protein